MAFDYSFIFQDLCIEKDFGASAPPLVIQADLANVQYYSGADANGRAIAINPPAGKVTWSQITARKTANDSTQYQRDRAPEYVKTSDPLGFEWLYMDKQADPGATAKLAEWLAAVEQIKADHPKP